MSSPKQIATAESGYSSTRVSDQSKRYCCILCPDAPLYNRVRRDLNRPRTRTVQRHVEEKHPGWDYRELAAVWGWRVRYRDGEVRFIPLAESREGEEDHDGNENDNDESQEAISNA